MEEEIWKDVIGFEGKYQVSNFGNVRSLNYDRSHKIKNMSLTYNKNNGYLELKFHIRPKCYYKIVHRLVAEAFIPNPDNLPEVNHKDENKKNNCVDNLEWCTGKYNVNYGTGHKRATKNIIKTLGRCVQCIETGEVFRTMADAGRKYNINPGNIGNACIYRNYTPTAGGYHWKYITLEEYNAFKNN